MFRRLLDEQQRHLRLLDLATGAEARDVVQFRPRGETVTAVAIDGASILAGTTDAIYRIDGDSVMRIVAPCSVRGRLAERVVSIAPLGAGGLAATLALPGTDADWLAGGLVRVERNGFAWRCDVPGVDVPDAPAHAVAAFGDVVYLATWEGLTRVQGPDSELYARGDGTPAEPPTAVASDGHGGAWVGTWGGGAYHVSGTKVDVYRRERGGLVGHEAMALGR